MACINTLLYDHSVPDLMQRSTTFKSPKNTSNLFYGFFLDTCPISFQLFPTTLSLSSFQWFPFIAYEAVKLKKGFAAVVLRRILLLLSQSSVAQRHCTIWYSAFRSCRISKNKRYRTIPVSGSSFAHFSLFCVRARSNVCCEVCVCWGCVLLVRGVALPCVKRIVSG